MNLPACLRSLRIHDAIFESGCFKPAYVYDGKRFFRLISHVKEMRLEDEQ